MNKNNLPQALRILPKSRGILLMLALWLLAIPATFAQYEFKSLTIGGGGYVTGVVVHPTEANLVYARTDVGGAYRWDASAKKWIQLITVDAMPDALLNYQNEQGPGVARHAVYAVESIAIDPSNPNVLYVAAGDGLYEGAEGFMLKSTDRGNSFVLTNMKGVQMHGGTEARTYGERLVVDPKNANIVYFGSRNAGVWKSTNAGINWTQIAASKVPFGGKIAGSDVGIVSMVVDDQSGNPSRVYAASAYEGIYRSDDGGQNWSEIYEGGLVTEMECVGGVLFASIKDKALRKYTPQNGWTDIIPKGDIYMDDIAVDPTNNNIIYAVDQNGFEDFYRSTDQGATWTTLVTDSRSEEGRNNFRSNDIPWVANSTVREWISPGNLVIDPHNTSRMWFAEGMGMWVSNDIANTNDAPTFDNISQGIEEMVATDVAATGNTVTMMTWDRAGFVKEKSNINAFPTEQIGLTDEFTTGVSVEVAPGNPNFLTAVISDHRGCCGDGNFSGYSEDGGLNWTKFGSINGEYNSPSTLKFGEVVTSATDVNNMVWVSRQNQNTELYYSQNKGVSWTKSTLASDGYYNSSFTFLTSKKVLTSDAVIGGKFYSYAWQPGRIFVSTDQGATWDYASASPNLPFTVWHGQLKAAPGKANHLWFSTGYDHREGPSERGLFFSQDGGANFTQMPDVSDCWAFGFGKAKAGADYATIFMYGIVYGEWGLYRSTDRGESWEKLVDYPLGLFDIVTTVSGDPSIFGRVYIGYKGNSFVYGQGDDVPGSPTVNATAVTVSPTSTSLAVGATQQLSASVSPSNATNKSVSWTSDNTSVATVSSSGVVKGVAAGTANITVKTADGGFTAKTAITVSGTPTDNPSGELSTAVSRSSDDAEQNLGSGAMDLSSDDLDLRSSDVSAMRFALQVPQGASVSEARVSFVAKGNTSGANTLVFRIQAANNANAFTSSNSNLSGRSTSSSSVSWSPASWTDGQTYTSPDLSGLIQAVVNRSGWASGNSVVLLVSASGSNSNKRAARTYDYNGNSSQAPSLSVSYSSGGTSGGGGSSDGTVLLRASGAMGGEQLSLRLNGNSVKSWILTQGVADYTYTGSVSGNIQVSFDNDNGARDVVLDYIRVNGTTLQAEDQAVNTARWSPERNSCGDSYSEVMQCTGYIDFGSPVARQQAGVLKSKAEAPRLGYELKLYPNPSTGLVQVLLPESALVQVHNSVGQLVLEQEVQAGQSSLDLSKLGHGMHMVSTTIQGQRQVQRLILK